MMAVQTDASRKLLAQRKIWMEGEKCSGKKKACSEQSSKQAKSRQTDRQTARSLFARLRKKEQQKVSERKEG